MLGYGSAPDRPSQAIWRGRFLLMWIQAQKNHLQRRTATLDDSVRSTNLTQPGEGAGVDIDAGEILHT